RVETEVQPDGVVRRYWCACQKRAQTGRLLLGSDEGMIWEFVTNWRCDGHPALELPAVLDGVPISEDDSVLDAAVLRGLREPPFMPPDTDSPGIWVVRLYWILGEERLREKVGYAVAKCLFSDDPI